MLLLEQLLLHEELLLLLLLLLAGRQLPRGGRGWRPALRLRLAAVPLLLQVRLLAVRMLLVRPLGRQRRRQAHALGAAPSGIQPAAAPVPCLLPSALYCNFTDSEALIQQRRLASQPDAPVLCVS